jgi:short-subunit dehydrogenase
MKQQKFKTKYGEWAVVTGATSGIGKALAIVLAALKINLIVNGRNKAALEALKIDIEKNYGIEIITIEGDITDAGVCTAMVNTSNEHNIGLFIAAAGFGTSGNFTDNNILTELNMLDVNCKAVLQLTHFFANKFKQQQRGGIILFSSLVAFQGVPKSANYAASKAYIQSLGEALYHELKPNNVDVLTVAPGPVKTGFGKVANLQMNLAANTAQIIKPILNALGKKQTVVPGFIAKFLTYSLATLPRYYKVVVMKKIMTDMTKHQNK